jgi:hypothetical protein
MADQELTPRQFAVKTGMSLHGIYQKIWESRLPAEKRDGCWFITITDQPEEKDRKGNDRQHEL